MTREPRLHGDPAEPRTDAPEHPVDPADAAFLDPAAVPERRAPSGSDEPATRPPGYGDYEGERAGVQHDDA